MTFLDRSGYRWAVPGDVNAFFGLVVDNLTNLVVLSGLLVGVFRFSGGPDARGSA
jgi:AGZA family xanthine/uracil permease-like MFS transporter